MHKDDNIVTFSNFVLNFLPRVHQKEFVVTQSHEWKPSLGGGLSEPERVCNNVKHLYIYNVSRMKKKNRSPCQRCSGKN